MKRTTRTAGAVTVRVKGIEGESAAGRAHARERIILGPSGQLGFPDSDLDLQRSIELLTGDTPRPLSILRAWRAPFRSHAEQAARPIDGAAVLRTIPKSFHPAFKAAEERMLNRVMALPADILYAQPAATRYARPMNTTALAWRVFMSARYRAPGYNGHIGNRGRITAKIVLGDNVTDAIVGTRVAWVESQNGSTGAGARDYLVVHIPIEDTWREKVWETGIRLAAGNFVTHWLDDPHDTTAHPRFIGVRQEPDTLSCYITRGQLVGNQVNWEVRR